MCAYCCWTWAEEAERVTLGEGKRKVLELLDEYGSGDGFDEELELRLPDLFDIAQKRLAQLKKILRCVSVERQEGQREVELPADCLRLYRVWRGDRLCTLRCRLRGRSLLLPELGDGHFVLEYFAMPRTVDEETGEDYVFEIAEDAAQCMPFFVAAEVLAADPLQDGRVLLGIYEAMVNDLDTALPELGQRVVNRLWGEGRGSW